MLNPSALFLAPLALCSGRAFAQQATIIEIAPGYTSTAFADLRLSSLSVDSTPWIALGSSLQLVNTAGTPQQTLLAQGALPTDPLTFLPTIGRETDDGSLLMLAPDPNSFLSAVLLLQPSDGAPAFQVGNLGRSGPIWQGGQRQFLTRIGSEIWGVLQEGLQKAGIYRFDGTGQLIGQVPLPAIPAFSDLSVATVHSFGDRALLFVPKGSDATLWEIDSTGAPTQVQHFANAGSGSVVLDTDFLQAKLLAVSGAGSDSGIWFLDKNLGIARIGAATPPTAWHGLVVQGSIAYAVSTDSTATLTGTRILKFDGQGVLSAIQLDSTAVLGRNNLALLAGRLVFASQTGGLYPRPFVTDGTLAGTSELAPVDAIVNTSAVDSFPIRSLAGAAYFVGRAADGDFELWRTDGTPAGTAALAAFPSAKGGAARKGYAVAGQRLVLLPDLGNGALPQFYSVDGLGGQPQQLVDAEYELPNGQISSDVAEFQVFAAETLFSAQSAPQKRQVWSSDGSASGTAQVTDQTPTPGQGTSFLNSESRLVTTIGRYALVVFGGQTYALDVLSKQLTLLADVGVGEAVRQGDDLLFTGYRLVTPQIGLPFGQGAVEGWVYRTRGTPATTQQLFSLDFSSLPAGQLQALDDRFLIALNTPGEGQELWTSDGTAAGTTILSDAVPGPAYSYPRELTRVADRAFFAVSNLSAAVQRRLYVTDGSTAGTALLLELALPQALGQAKGIVGLHAYGNRLVFAARDQSGELEPWISDGTPGGTQRLLDLGPTGLDAALASNIEEWTSIVAGGRYWFARRLASPSRMELWVSDGSPAGTVLVRSFDNPETTTLNRFVDVGLGSQVLFSIADEAGLEPWVSAGTFQGTRRLFDLFPGPKGSITSALNLVAAQRGARLYFSAIVPLKGRELALLPLSVTGGWAKTRLGESCGGVLGRPEIDATGSATLGQAVSIEVGGLAPQGLVILQFGAEPSLPLGAGQCALQLVAPQLFGFALTGSNGQASFPLSVPQNPNLIDRAAYFQALALDPSAGFLGLFSLSQVLEIAIGG